MKALILAGGSGTRFWPVSRRSHPKQLLALDGQRSLLQATVDRLTPLIEPAEVWICTTAALADAVRAQLPEVPADQVLEEPCGRNTAPAIGWALSAMPDPEGIVAVLPADHRFTDPEAFRATLAAAAEHALRDDLVLTLGVEPRWAETGYGYLEVGEATTDGDDLRPVRRFREKPDPETAQRYVASGRYWWNAGMFVFRGATLLRHLDRLEPAIGQGLRQIAAEPARLAELYPELPSTSIDYAVMERLDEIAALPLDCGWSDLGSWAALDEVLPGDADGNSTHGQVVAIDSRDNLLWAAEGTIAVVGVEGLAVVRTGDTVLVMPKERSQDVKQVVDQLLASDRTELL